MLLPVFLIEGTDDDPLAGAGMDELAVFQVDTYMSGPLLLPAVVEEHQVALFQFSLLNFPAILFALIFGISFEAFAIHLMIYSGCQARTIHTSLGRSASSVGDT